MKKSLFFYFSAIVLFMLLSISSKAQSKADTSKYPYWIAMMQDTGVNYFDVQRAFYKYYSKHTLKRKHKKMEDEAEEEENERFNQFKRWEYNMRTKINPDGSRQPADQIMKEYYKHINTPSFTTFGTSYYSANPAGNWIALGPSHLPANRTGYEICGMGRVNAIAFDPKDTAKYYLGAPAGGLWVTSNSGKSWTSLTDALPTLGVSAIAIDKNADSVIYIGTGDRDHNDAPGLGVMKSTNNGKSWTPLNSRMGNVTVSKLLIFPNNTKEILAATSGGIFRSANGGAKWLQVSSDSAYYKDMVFKPHHPNVVYAESHSKFYRSTDSGKSFSLISNGLPVNYRGVIGVTPADTNYVYFIEAAEYAFSGCYLSTDGGTSFTKQSSTPNILDWSDAGTGTSGQGFYDLCVSVDTSDKSLVNVGGVNVFQSNNSGVDWNILAHWTAGSNPNVPVIHADQHIMAINPLNNRQYEGNDGGIYYTPDRGISWTCVSGNAAITQSYKIAQSPVRQDLIMIGCQDNATSILDRGQWLNVIGGDGTGVAMDTKDTNYNYGCYVYGVIYQSNSAGLFYSEIAGKGINGIPDSGNWVTPYALCKKNNRTMFAGYHNLYICSGLLKSGLIFWTQISNNLAGSNNNTLNVIEQSNVDTNLMYMSRTDNKLFRSSNVLSASPTWTDLTSSLPGPGLIIDIKTHPKYANVVYIIQNQKVYQSTDQGSTWKNISGTLPKIPLNCLIIDSNARSGIYVGTGTGVYYRDSTMSDWVAYSANLPVAVEVYDMKIYYDTTNSSNNMLKSATFGRGTWATPLYSKAPVGFSIADTVVCLHSTVNFTDSSKGNPTTWNWAISRPGARTYMNGTNQASQNPQVRFDSTGYYSIKLTATNSAYTNFNTYTRYIHVIASPATVANASNTTICRGGKSILSATGASSYSWTSNPTGFASSSATPSVTPTTTTTYYIAATNLCGNKFDSVVIKVNPIPNANWSVVSDSDGKTIFKARDSMAKAYDWHFGDNSLHPNGSDSSTTKNPVYTYHEVGNFDVRLVVTNSFGCVSEMDSSINIPNATGIGGLESNLFNLKISPNPFSAALSVLYSLPKYQNVQLTLTDITGKQIAMLADANQSPGNYIYTLDAEKYNIPAGIYFLHIVAGNVAVVEKVVRIR